MQLKPRVILLVSAGVLNDPKTETMQALKRVMWEGRPEEPWWWYDINMDHWQLLAFRPAGVHWPVQPYGEG